MTKNEKVRGQSPRQSPWTLSAPRTLSQSRRNGIWAIRGRWLSLSRLRRTQCKCHEKIQQKQNKFNWSTVNTNVVYTIYTYAELRFTLTNIDLRTRTKYKEYFKIMTWKYYIYPNLCLCAFHQNIARIREARMSIRQHQSNITDITAEWAIKVKFKSLFYSLSTKISLNFQRRLCLAVTGLTLIH